MKLLLFSDLHCSHEDAAQLVKQSRDVDLVLGAGDFATMRTGLEATIEILSGIECPTLLVAGNSESPEELRSACEAWPSAQVLHGQGTTIDGVEFFGLGGAVPVTPFGSWSYDLTEDQARELLADFPAGGVLLSHSPPRSLVDRDSSGQSLGSEAVWEVVERENPRLVVCGHIHASWKRIEEHRTTTVINAGPRGMVWELK